MEVTIDSDPVHFSQILRSAILWPACAIFITALALLSLTLWLFQDIRWYGHSYDVLAKTRMAESLVYSSQNNLRGFLLTGDPIFQKAFEDDSSRLNPALAQLKILVKDNPEQLIRAEDILRAQQLWMEHANTMIAHRTQNTPLNPDWVRMGKSLVDDFGARFEKFIQVEDAIRQDRQNRINHLKHLVVYAGSALAIFLSLLIGRLVRRQFMKLEQAHRAALKISGEHTAALTRSEADLEEQKEWFRVTLGSIGDGVIVTDKEGRVVFINKESERLTDWTASEALLKPITTVFKIIDEQSRTPVENPVTKVFREKTVAGLANHTVLLSRFGREWPIEDSVAPVMDSKGQMQGVVLVFHDASSTRSEEKILKAYSVDLEKKVAERTMTLQRNIRELETFSYSVSHDLRSPLRAMQGFAQAVQEDYGDKLDDQGRDYLTRIMTASQRLDQLIQDMLAYTRISRQESEVVPVDLQEIIGEVIEQEPNLQPPSVVIQIDGKLARVMGQKPALIQMFSNLLNNAAKFVPKGVTPQIHIRGEDLGSRYRVWVEDNGIGISPENRDRIFEMFVQVNDPHLYGGTGIGLAIVKKAAEIMHGSVGVESEPGKGSRFWLELARG